MERIYSLCMLKSCNVCQSNSLSSVWALPDFPLTGVYVDDPHVNEYQTEYQQELQYCNECSHAQLANQIDPTFLYRDTYTHRTSESPISSNGNAYLLKYIRDITRDRKFNQVLEIGCNDLYLLENLRDRSVSQAGIDPIWPDGIRISENGFRLWGGFAESTDYSELLESKIDLVITAHTFEHVTNPKVAIESLKGYLSENCIFIIEVPSAERMLEQTRLDQVFNQHVNYYSVKSVEKLLQPLGFKLQNLNYNYSYWGGTQLLTFALNDSSGFRSNARNVTERDYLSAITAFKNNMKGTSKQIEDSPGPVYLYGAAQMLPSLIYHFSEKAISKIVGIVDDNPSRQNKFYPNIGLRIFPSGEISDFSNATIVISALDSSRPILSRLLKLVPRTIIMPNGLI
jgi:hypothetical protein